MPNSAHNGEMRKWHMEYFYGDKFRTIKLDARNIVKAIETLKRIQYDKSKPVSVSAVWCLGYARYNPYNK
ncbi:hypothetical protein BCP78_0166 [Bacillus phage BCP78]|uniref:Uncharacterized protein n=3 Tax=Tsarbombavirus BCP78 TaxID=1985182 RepID=J9PR18_9CAUD|nr:hypothetical protein BCP78_0166 [Bacillus phage BCP78]YP_009783529.1 hypothetical protein QLX27_gp156 [Bacillus phage BCU4]AEW47173.1 hypothetical protein BCP78_0166 [Bacillus phage BCP78]AEW47662.1 hypothetical protein BCU4_0156 [Bacillus phage BCU4]AQN32541.1 hypothetical protein BCP12_129 [Bacillus phage BCP12]